MSEIHRILDGLSERSRRLIVLVPRSHYKDCLRDLALYFNDGISGRTLLLDNGFQVNFLPSPFPEAPESITKSQPYDVVLAEWELGSKDELAGLLPWISGATSVLSSDSI